MKFWIYKITHIDSGRVYVGKTNGPGKRWTAHKSIAKSPTHKAHSFLHSAIAKYGDAAFRFEVIDATMTESGAYRAEQVWIEHLNCKAPNGFNLDAGGLGTVSPSQQTIERLSAIAKERWRTQPERMFIPPTFLGRRHSPEAIQKIRAARRKQLPPRLGKTTPPDVRRKLSESNRRTWADPEMRIRHGQLVSSRMADKRES